MEILITVTVSLLILLVSVLNLIRVERFSKFMRAEVARVYDLRTNGKREEPYPNVMASFDNLKWYDIFNYKFDNLVVYDRPTS